MSVDAAKSALEGFLGSTEPGMAIALTGGWGRGKTHCWKQIIQKHCSENEHARYAYVSLYGVNSVEAIKNEIVINAEYAKAKSSLSEATDKAFEAGSYLINKGKQLFKNALSSPENAEMAVSKAFESMAQYKNLSDLAKGLSFKRVNGYIICIDDLERRGDGLKLKDILGFVSHLKEERNCKVIVILNDGHEGLKGDKEEFDISKEKVFDFEVRYAPTPVECCDIAFNGMDTSLAHVAECSQLLQITNIRILRRIRSVVEYFAPLCAEYHPEIMVDMIRAAALLTWAYNKDPAAPPYEIIKSMQQGWARFFKQDDLELKVDPEIKRILERYPYSETDEMDLQVCHYLEYGYIEKQSFNVAIDNKSTHYNAVEKKSRINGLQAMLRESFDHNEDQFIAATVNCVTLNSEWMDIGTIHSLLGIIRKLGKDSIATEMISTWVSSMIKNHPSQLKIVEYPWQSTITDRELIDAMSIADQSLSTRISVIEVADRLISGIDWDEPFERSLSAITEDDLFKLFKETRGEKLPLYVSVFVGIRSAFNGRQMKTHIDAGNLYLFSKSALKKISKESSLNRLRVEMFMPDIFNGDAEVVE